MFAVGFALREYGAFHYMFSTQNLNIYIASTCLIYMSPYVITQTKSTPIVLTLPADLSSN